MGRRLRLHAHAGHASDYAGRSGLCRRGARGKRVFFGAYSAIEGLRSRPGTTYIGSWDWVWEDAGAQFAIAWGVARFYGPRAPGAARGFAQVLYWKIAGHATGTALAGNAGLRMSG